MESAAQLKTNDAVVGRLDPVVILRLIHYGADCYKPEMFRPISDVPFRNKPQGGLWTSPVDSEYGWKDWAEDNDYGDLTKHFELEFQGTVLKIDSVADMNELPWIEVNGSHFISFQALCAMWFSYDAIHLTAKGERDTRFSHPRDLYGWDCESVLVMNPDAIRAI